MVKMPLINLIPSVKGMIIIYVILVSYLADWIIEHWFWLKIIDKLKKFNPKNKIIQNLTIKTTAYGLRLLQIVFILGLVNIFFDKYFTFTITAAEMAILTVYLLSIPLAILIIRITAPEGSRRIISFSKSDMINLIIFIVVILLDAYFHFQNIIQWAIL